MDFFQAQDDARLRTKRMVVLFVLAVLSIAAALYAVVVAANFFLLTKASEQAPGIDLWQPTLLLWTVLGVVVLVVACASIKIAQLRSGGGAVARSVGGRPVDSATNDPDERKLLNIVQEMSIASGTPMPEVFILEEESINAFAAGFQPADAAIAVTRGCIRNLSRDELQGVVAHEFSHILNGDMRLNIRLCGVLFGILAIAVLGRVVLRATAHGSMMRGSRRSKEGGGAMLAIFALSLAIMAIGYIGVLFGRLIQSAISRQREFLADAAAIQFTRNPDSIGGALKKIGAHSTLGQVKNPHAEELAHCFFASAFKSSFGGAFATHPPLDQRIRAIEPNWDGKFAQAKRASSRATVQKSSTKAKGSKGQDPKAFMQSIGTLGAATILYAEKVREQISPQLDKLQQSPEAAMAALLALAIISGGAADPEPQLKRLSAKLDPEGIEAVRGWIPELRNLDADRRFALLEIALPKAIAQGGEQISIIQAGMREMANADGVINLEELALLRITRNFAENRKNPSRRPQSRSPKELEAPIQLTLSALVHCAQLEGDTAQNAFDAGLKKCGQLLLQRPSLLPQDAIDLDALDQALCLFAQLPGSQKKAILEAAIHTVLADNKIDDDERSLIRAIAASMDLPMPPLKVS